MSLADAGVAGPPPAPAGPDHGSAPAGRRTIWPRSIPPPEPVAVLLVTEASGQERVVTVGGSALTIGRERGCAVRIDSPRVSPRHARIEPRPAGPTLVDLGGDSSAALNGARLREPALLRVGDVITIADARITCLGEPREPVTPKLTATPDDAPDRPAADRLYLDPQSGEIRLGERRLSRRPSAQEMALLRYLYERAEQTCRRAELGDAIWGPDNWDATMLYRLIGRLRDKIEPDPAQPRYLHSVTLVGYRLVR